MTVSAWTNGSSGYGLKIKRKDIQKYFMTDWKKVNIIVQLKGKEEIISANIAKQSFWTGCGELINKRYKDYFMEHGGINWKPRHPSKFELTQIKEKTFKLEEI